MHGSGWCWPGGFQGADTDMEKLTYIELLFEAVLGELGVVGQGHHHLILGDIIVEPSKLRLSG